MSLYAPLHVRSAYSLGRGTALPAALVEQAAAYGHEALALTDRNNLYGAPRFLEACRDWGVRPILGAEIDGPDGLAVFLVRDRIGYANLSGLITRRHLEADFTLLRALADPGAAAGLHVFTDDPALLMRLARVVPRGSLWVELAGPGRSDADFAALVEAGRTVGADAVATGAVTFLRPADFGAHAVLAAARETTLVARLGAEDLAHRGALFKPPAAMASLFRRFPRALAATRAVADSCRYVPARDRWIFPRVALDPGDTPGAYLRRLCEEGLRRRYGPHPEPGRLREARTRLDRELAVIERLGFPDYFVIVGEIVRFARSRNIATVGRGSGAGALTAYLLGITNVDPLRYGLSFERFLHEKRPDCPDLDVDLCWKRRDEVIDFVYRTYGRDRVAMISTHTTYQPRAAFREAARAHGVPVGTVDRLSRCVPHRAEITATGRPGEAFTAALDAASRGREVPRREEPWPRVLADAERILGLPRHLGVHPGGVVIADRPLTDYVPLEEAAKGIVVTQFEMRGIEAVGLVKMDLLGNRALSTIQECVDLVAARTGTRLDPDAFPDPDPRTAALFAAGDTLGVFQMESPGMRNLNRMLRTRGLADVIAAVALIRPGPAGSGMKDRFVRRARGLERPAYVDPRLEPVLRETYGVPLYEEDVMRIAAAVAGLSLEDGDVVRRAIAGAREEERRELGRVFLREAERRGFSREAATAIWNGLLRFGAFAFCKAHAAGYGVLAYQAGWLKAHHPVEFAVAILNHHAGMYDPRVHLEDAKRRGVRVLLPDVNRAEDASAVEDGAVRIGLGRVRGVSERSCAALLEARARRLFRDLEDFLVRVPVSRPEAEALVLAGAFDFTGRPRPELLAVVAVAHRALGDRARRPGRDGDALFETEAPPRSPLRVPSLPDFLPEEKLWLEWRTLGLCAGPHPMTLFRRAGLPRGTLSAAEAEASIGRSVRVAGLVAAMRTVPTRAGAPMQFVTLEDETGMIECTLFPATYARHRGTVRGLGPYLAEGAVDEQLGAPTVTVRAIRALAVTPELWEAERRAAAVAAPVRGRGATAGEEPVSAARRPTP